MSFTCFSRLPPEVRLEIWKFATPGARTVTLSTVDDATYYVGDSERTGKDIEVHAPDFDTVQKLYTTCRESHNIIKAKFNLLDLSSLQLKQSDHPTWFNNKVDTLYVSDWLAWFRLSLAIYLPVRSHVADMRSVRNLAFMIPNKTEGFPLPQYRWDMSEYLVFNDFRDLKQLIFVAQKDKNGK